MQRLSKNLYWGVYLQNMPVFAHPADVANMGWAKCYSLLTLGITFLWSGSVIPSVNAQIVPDRTLPQNSAITREGTIERITGGTQAGGNLFHSFQEFSLPTGSTARFDNATTIENIITRVTGGNISQIDGIIQANGNASLFLINPNGIVFGPNASLNIGGSFIGSTASSIKFADGMEYSAINPETPPLLTISVPVGLQFGGNPNSPGEIQVMGVGHSLNMPINSIYSRIEGAGNSRTGLAVIPGQTLALVGGAVTLDGGVLTAPGGKVELGSVGAGEVSLLFSPPAKGGAEGDKGWRLGYERVQEFRDIALNNQAAVDASGTDSGSISVIGNNITLKDGAAILIENQGENPSGTLELIANSRVQIIGESSNGQMRTGLFQQIVGNGRGGDVNVTASSLEMKAGSGIFAVTFSNALGGNVNLNISDRLQLVGGSPLNPVMSTRIGAITFNGGTGGAVAVNTGSIRVIDGATIVALTLGSGGGGDTTVNARDFIEMVGANSVSFQGSVIAASTLNAGNGGNLTINTGRLTLSNGGVVSASNLATGSAGSLTINARESIEVTGAVPGAANPSVILSSAVMVEPIRQQLYNIGPVPSGSSGSIIINTPVLRVTDKGQVAARNDGTGNGGDIRINAGEIFMGDLGGITAATNSGEGGNIILATDWLQLRGGGFITATSRGTGNGGNININGDIIAALENSDITANAVTGAGGNIQINSRGIFGTEFRPFPTVNSDITASSQFGFSGNVTIHNPDANPSSGLDQLPENVVDATEGVIVGCAAAQGNSFTVTGRGGLPENPLEPLRGETLWEDLRVISAFESRDRETTIEGDGNSVGAKHPSRNLSVERRISYTDASPYSWTGTRRNESQGRALGLIEANGWVVYGDGSIDLVAENKMLGFADAKPNLQSKHPSCQDF